eukprot:TRINITY_DN68014_c0_g1_i1.p1 TRINITY_DN68014_c0_g1~~TRINITY_DN68014_c0_g1_i1.p1  ORF type:complete len:482 (+),score=56.33 TRINITY_DN68014_c0_g1_i1:58-1446(+)
MVYFCLHRAHVTPDLSFQALQLNKGPFTHAQIASKLASLRRCAKQTVNDSLHEMKSSISLHLDSSSFYVSNDQGHIVLRLPLMLAQVHGVADLGTTDTVGVLAYGCPFYEESSTLTEGEELSEPVLSLKNNSDVWLILVCCEGACHEASATLAMRGVTESLACKGAILSESSCIELAGQALGYGSFSTVLPVQRQVFKHTTDEGVFALGEDVSHVVDGWPSKMAAKVMPSDCSLECIMKEAIVLKRVSGHPNVATLVGIFAEELTPGVAEWTLLMVAHEGDNLANRVQNHGPYTSRAALSVVGDILSALCHIHSKHVIHGDVTTVNVVATEQRAVLVGFSLAVMLPESSTANVRFGTPGFASPELLVMSMCTPKADVFSCGVVLYYVLSGIEPFCGATEKEVLRKNAMVDFTFPAEHFSQASEALLNLTRSMMKMNPQQRLCSAEALSMARSVGAECVELVL